MAYEVDIRTLGELWFFLFRKKHCQNCRGKVYRVDFLPEFSSGFERSALDFEYVHKTKKAVRCRQCALA